MPELPEVETVRRGLARRVKNKRIKDVEVRKASMVRGSATGFTSTLRGNAFTKIDRRGKLLVLHLRGVDGEKRFLLIHLKMTGQLIYDDGKERTAGGHPWPRMRGASLPHKHTHVTIEFADNSTLYFNDLRRFGYMQIVDDKGLSKVLANYGPEPFDMTWEYFREKVKKRKTSLKAVLLNQSVVAGLGNIYVDEVAHRAGVRPQRRVTTLTETELKRIFKAIPKVLQEAIAFKGTTFNNFRDHEGKAGNFVDKLRVYGRSGKKCKKCGAILKKIKVAQRGTIYCPQCQR